MNDQANTGPGKTGMLPHERLSYSPITQRAPLTAYTFYPLGPSRRALRRYSA